MRLTAIIASGLWLISGPALAQAPAPRDIPEGFVLPGPPPKGAAANPVLAAPEHHGTADWPCMQRKVARMDAAQIWPAAPETAAAAERTPAERQLVREIAQRRVAIPDARQRLTDYLAALPTERRKAAAEAVFVDLLHELNRERADVINGIGRYAGKQKTLAESIRAETAKFDRLMSQPMPDQNEVAREQEALLWQTRVFDERRQSLTYVCEVPVLIEQRMFALGRVLRDAAVDGR
ncbi:hypothetical protein NDN16_00985 [Aureimonas altamirensis]|uniref:hypothetical protein n=1 Tax=Aureimonas altamirensis TaxID=370622 RepID=UPI0020366C90|nr:hypothetical protein [Aureimonas altamirensis]MCM2502241.1 hypothetical protein [Aureimonas altamirensis]